MIRITVDEVAAPQLRKNLAGLQDRVEAALRVAANMAASMIEAGGKAGIAQAGNFGASWTEGLHVNVAGDSNNLRIVTTHDDPRVALFETGGTVHGKPLLWIPISGTDAEGIRAGQYGGLVSGNPPGHPPLLFSIADHRPKYFGVESVTIPQKFFLRDWQKEVMWGFGAIFSNAFRG